MQTEKVVDFIVDWLKEYAVTARVSGYVIGISGGIDSAVVSVLAARTGLPLLCLEMPIYQAENQMNRAKKHIAQLKGEYPNVKSLEIDLTGLYDRFIAGVTDHIPDAKGMALVNTRARLRMTTLYYYGAVHQSLVVGTGNKVEDFGVGFYTKYGDGGVDVSPIADLMKTEVFELGAHFGLIDEIMTAAPTDGLWGDDRTDEDQLGATYPELEWAMCFEESGGDTASLTIREKAVLEIYRSRHRANRHKMDPIPVCHIPLALKA